MNMLQIPSTFTDLVGWFDSLNIVFKVLVAIVAILLSIILICIAFKLIEVSFLLIRVILESIITIFRKSSKKKIIIGNEESEKPEGFDSLKKKKGKNHEDTNSIDFYFDKGNFREEGTSKSKKFDLINRSNKKEFIPENSINIIQCPNCGKKASQNSFSKIGDTLFVSCEECGKRYITNGENISEN